MALLYGGWGSGLGFGLGRASAPMKCTDECRTCGRGSCTDKCMLCNRDSCTEQCMAYVILMLRDECMM